MAASTFPSALRGREGSDRFQLSHQRVPKTGRVATGAKSHGRSLGCRAAIGWDQLQCGDGCVWQGAGVADGIGTLSGQGFPNSFFFLLSNCSAVQSIVCHPTSLGASKNRPLARWPTGFPQWVPQETPQELRQLRRFQPLADPYSWGSIMAAMASATEWQQALVLWTQSTAEWRGDVQRAKEVWLGGVLCLEMGMSHQ